MRVTTLSTGVLISAMPCSADHSNGHDSTSSNQSISWSNPDSRPTASISSASFTVAGQSQRQGRWGTARAPIQRQRMLACAGPSMATAQSSVRSPVAIAIGQVVSTIASSTQTRRKNSRQHGG